MQSLALLNQKGGSGKTTSAISLGAVLSRKGHRVLLIDLDPQGSLSRWMSADDTRLTQLFEGRANPADVVQRTRFDNIEIAAADRSLSKLSSMRATRIRDGIKRLLTAAESHFDYALLDPPPSTGPLVLATLLSADGILAPVQAGLSAVDGLGDTLQLMRRVQERTESASFFGAFACRVDIRTRSDQQVPDLLKKELGDRAFDTFIRETVAVREAESARVPPPLYAPDATASTDYESLTDELLHHE